MSAKSSSHVSMRIETAIKDKAEAILNDIGISRSQAMKMLYKRVIKDRGWPCELKELNAETVAVFEATDRGEDLTVYNNVDEMFADLHASLEEGVVRPKEKK